MDVVTKGTKDWLPLELIVSKDVSAEVCDSCQEEAQQIVKIGKRKIYICGSDECESKSFHIGEEFILSKEEAWGLRNFSGTKINKMYSTPAYQAQYEVQSFEDNFLIFEIRSGCEDDSTLIKSFSTPLNRQGDFYYPEVSDDFAGKLIEAKDEDDTDLYFCIRFMLSSELSSDFRCLINFSATFEKIINQPIEAALAALPTAVDSENGERFVHDLYYIPYDEAEMSETAKEGYHELPDKRGRRWHECPKCMKIIHEGYKVGGPGGLEFVQGGEKEEVLKKGKGKIGDKEQTEEKILTNFKGGEKAEELPEKMSVAEVAEGNHSANEVECRICKTKGREDDPPVCPRKCPKAVINDMIFSSWHKGPDGKYHSCDTCVDRLFAANDLK